MKAYKKTYYLDNGSNLEITIKDRTLEDINEDIDETINKDYVREKFENKTIVINMEKVAYIYVEELSD